MTFTIIRRLAVLVGLSVAGSLFATVMQLNTLWHSLVAERRETVKSHVESSMAILKGALDSAEKGYIGRDEALTRAKDAIRSIRYGKNDYLYVIDTQGVGIVHPMRHDFEGANILGLTDVHGVKIVQTLIEAAKAGTGYAWFHFPRGGKSEPIRKLSYAGLVEPLGWMVGAGVYMDDLNDVFWQEARSAALLAVILIGLLCAVSTYLALGLARPIKALTAAMGELASGNLTLTVPGLARRDEVGAMAKAVEHFRRAGLEKVRLEEQAAAQRAASERAWQQAADEDARIAREREQAVGAMAHALSRLAGNDLRYRIRDEVPAGYERLRDDFNLASANLAAALDKVSDSATGIAAGTKSIASAADDLSRRTEVQAASVEETSAALTEISKAIAVTAAGTREAQAVATQARKETERTGEIVTSTVEAIGGIARSSKQVSQIIGVIDEIAFQTNLLALNAGVEAARAGEAGRGFAVVASEVRALAQRSADAAKEIKTLITSSGADVDNGVRTVTAAQEALSKIAGYVSTIEQVITRIAGQSGSQADTLREVNEAIGQLNQATQENAAMVEEATAACNTLDGETRALETLMAEFETANARPQLRAVA